MKYVKWDFSSMILLDIANNAMKVVQNVLGLEKEIALHASSQKNYMNSNAKNIVLNIFLQ